MVDVISIPSFKITSVLMGSWYLVQGQTTHSATLLLLLHYIKPRAIMPIFYDYTTPPPSADAFHVPSEPLVP